MNNAANIAVTEVASHNRILDANQIAELQGRGYREFEALVEAHGLGGAMGVLGRQAEREELHHHYLPEAQELILEGMMKSMHNHLTISQKKFAQ